MTHAQITLDWSGYTAGSTFPSYTYTRGTAPNNMSVTVTKNGVTMSESTPKNGNNTTYSSCTFSNQLFLYTAYFSSNRETNNSHVTVDIRFNPGYSGSCGYVEFIIKDINSDVDANNEYANTFCDVVEISAIDGNGNTISATTSDIATNNGTGIFTTLASNVNRSTISSGTKLKLIGHSNSNETKGNYSRGAACGETKVRIKPPQNVWIRSVTIKYRPAYGTSSSNAYCGDATCNRPAAQWISISNISLITSTGCPIPLPIELSSFKGKSVDRTNILSWVTASELNNDYFELERSIDGEEWEKVARVEGAGSTTDIHTYNYVDKDFEYVTNYYRLKQVDYDGASKESEIIVIDNSVRDKTLVKILNSLGQEVSEEEKGLKFYIYSDGTVVKQMN